MSKWKDIWNKDERINKVILECLIKSDGFDSGAGSFTVDDWIEYTKYLYDKIEINENDNIYDIGCGSGAFVYPLYLKNHKIGGLDYSKTLIKLANQMILNSDFINEEAINIDINKTYNIVVSHSVFHYFIDLNYAKNVIYKMLKKSNNKIAIFDINDESKKDEYHRIRREGMKKEEYEIKYKGLEHMFYSKEWFLNIANELNLKIEIFDQNFGNYTNSKLRFNVIMEK